MNATASDTDGSIAKVEFFNGSTLLKTFTAPQATYNYLWENVSQGSYNLTAKATDNLGASTTSSMAPVTVTASVAKIYDIHTDHLGTPRMVTDVSGNSVWEWIGTPFGESLPNQNPSNTGTQNDFVMNLRFPGQVFDKETGLHYNYYRDYDPSTGRYVQSDPIGLLAGVNTFGYVRGRPLVRIDRLGLQDTGTYVIVPWWWPIFPPRPQPQPIDPGDLLPPKPIPSLPTIPLPSWFPDWMKSPKQCEDEKCERERKTCHPICSAQCTGVGLGSDASACYRKCMRGCLSPKCADNY